MAVATGLRMETRTGPRSTIEAYYARIRSVPHKRFNELQDKFFEVSKQMHEAKTVAEKMALLNELQSILKESQAALEEIHKKQSGSGSK
jgi:hypothetical protein